MKRIQFDRIHNNSYFFILMIISLICLLIGVFLPDFGNPRINKLFMSIGFITQILFLGRMFWFKNYVQYNKLGMAIKLNSFIDKTIKFEAVKNVVVNEQENQLVVDMGGKNIYKINTLGIANEDVFKLLDLIKINSNIK